MSNDVKYVELDFSPREHQIVIDEMQRRFTVMVCHRRFGKTLYTVAKCVQKALTCELPRPRAMYFCPTYGQAKRVAWDYLKAVSQPVDDRKINEAELRIDYPNGGRVGLGSAEDPDSSRGIYLDLAAVDEPAQMSPRMWSEVLRPALSDRKGQAIFLGTPAGRHGLLFDLWNQAGDEEATDWSRFMFKASETGILPDDELQAARKEMSSAEYQQEFECSFNAMIKGAYWGNAMNQAEEEGRICELQYDERMPVHVGMDLGVRHQNATWFFQFGRDGMVNFLHYAGYTRMGIPDIVRDWRLRPWNPNYGRCVVPHDIRNISWSTGKTRLDTLRALGVDAIEANRDLGLDDGIDLARSFISRSKFHVEHCKYGIEALRQFKSDWSDKNGVFRTIPKDDWAKDPADAFRYIATTDGIEGPSWKTEPDYSLMDESVAWG